MLSFIYTYVIRGFAMSMFIIPFVLLLIGLVVIIYRNRLYARIGQESLITSFFTGIISVFTYYWLKTHLPDDSVGVYAGFFLFYIVLLVWIIRTLAIYRSIKHL